MSQKGIIKNSVSKDISAAEWARIMMAILGGSGIVKIFGDLACLKVSDNLVTLSSGIYSLQGHVLGVDSTGATLAVDSGTAGYNRVDVVAAEFVRNGGGTGIDTLQFKVIKGTPTTGTPVGPTLTEEDLHQGGTTRQEALYMISIIGTTLSSIEQVVINLYPSSSKLNSDGGDSFPFSEMPYVGTAPIIERGSNTNGEYVKYADGTMDCFSPDFLLDATTALGSIFQTTDLTTWTFPVQFVAPPFVSGEVNSSSSWVSTANATFVASVVFRRLAAVSSATAQIVRLKASGRWM